MRAKCKCGAVFEIQADWAGKKIRCSKCSTVLRIPENASSRAKSQAAAPHQPTPNIAAQNIPAPIHHSAPTSQQTERPRNDDELLNRYLSDTLEARMADRAQSAMPEKRMWRGIKYIGIGVLAILFGIASFAFFVNLEQQGRIRRVNIIIAFLYMIGGKWLVLVVLGLIGILSIVAGVLSMLGIIWIDEDEDVNGMTP